MNDAWKEFERRVAEFLGWERVNAKGEDVSDVVGEGIGVAECKYRKELPKWLIHGWDQAHKPIYKDLPIKILALGLKNRRKGFYVVLESSTFKLLLDAYLARGGQADRLSGGGTPEADQVHELPR